MRAKALSKSDPTAHPAPQPLDGQRRAAALLKAKTDALGPKIEGPPSRQVLRSRQRKADKPQWRRQRGERIANRKAA